MSPTFTDDDVGNPVESADGEALGAVVAVDDETARVDPEPDMTDSIKAVLDWEPASGDTVPLESDAVDEITDETIRLRAQVSAESVDPDAEPESTSGLEGGDDRPADRADDAEPEGTDDRD